MRENMRSVCKVLVCAVATVALLLQPLPASAVVGTTTYVIVGGAQEPSKSYFFQAGDWASSYCTTPKAGANFTIRWYMTKVEPTRAYITKVYMTMKPTRRTLWDSAFLTKPNGSLAKPYFIINAYISAGVTASRTFAVNLWVPIETVRPIVLSSTIIPAYQGQEPANCNGEARTVNYLKRK